MKIVPDLRRFTPSFIHLMNTSGSFHPLIGCTNRCQVVTERSSWDIGGTPKILGPDEKLNEAES